MADKLERRRLPFTMIENRILEDESVSGHTLLVYLALCKHADSNDQCFPSFTALSKIARICRRKCQDAIKELINLGYLTKTIRLRKGGRSRLSNLYTLVKQYHYKPVAQDAIGRNDIWHDMPQGMARDALGYGMTCHVTRSNEQDPNNNKDNVQLESKSKSEYTPTFQSFWTAYPRKESKKAAFKCWKTKIKQGISEDTLISAAKNFTKAMKGQEKQYVKLASTFLGPNDHWEDFADDIPEAYQNKKFDPAQVEKDRLLKKAEKTMKTFTRGGAA